MVRLMETQSADGSDSEDLFIFEHLYANHGNYLVNDDFARFITKARTESILQFNNGGPADGTSFDGE